FHGRSNVFVFASLHYRSYAGRLLPCECRDPQWNERSRVQCEPLRYRSTLRIHSNGSVERFWSSCRLEWFHHAASYRQ
ncbi:hypothetical protein TELCIR_24710, partial [Teladorsagia circumcincta]